jgi:H+/Cl- antiporter ClcA
MMRDSCAWIAVILSAGGASALFLAGLSWVTRVRIENPMCLLLCPLAGLITGLLYHFVSPPSGKGNVLLAQVLRSHPESASRDEKIPARMSILILLSTWLAHLTGVSVGREGTAVQMAGGISAWVSKILRLSHSARWKLLLSASAAGFGSVFGVPLAGAFFAFETAGFFKPAFYDGSDTRTHRTGVARHEIFFLFALAFGASAGAHQVAVWLGTTHEPFPPFMRSDFTSWWGLLLFPLAAVAAGLAAWGFLFLLGKFRLGFAKLPVAPWLRPAVGGVPIALLYFAPTVVLRYTGLGTAVIHESFERTVSFFDPLVKIFATAYGIGAGFRGGEVTPLFFIGSTLGSSLAGIAGGAGLHALAGLSMVACFGAAAGLPLTCAVMAGELFGWPALLPAIPFCLLASYMCRSSRLYDH